MTYYLYIMSSKTGVLYIGVTNNLVRRTYEHRHELFEGFTKKYKCKKLVYYESSFEILSVLNREKQLKKWRREKKINLIKTTNPDLKDLSASLEMIQ